MQSMRNNHRVCNGSLSKYQTLNFSSKTVNQKATLHCGLVTSAEKRHLTSIPISVGFHGLRSNKNSKFIANMFDLKINIPFLEFTELKEAC